MWGKKVVVLAEQSYHSGAATSRCVLTENELSLYARNNIFFQEQLPTRQLHW